MNVLIVVAFVHTTKPRIVQFRDYYANGKAEGASPNTVGWEISTLSGIFGVLIDDRTITGMSAD
jgi:hypothetical protein